MERNERLTAANKCAEKYTDEKEKRIARTAFMDGCEFESQGEAVKGEILDTLKEQPVDLEKEIDDYYEMYRDEKGIAHDKDNGEICCDWKTGGREISICLMARHFYELGREHQRTLDADLGSPKYERGFEDGREYERKSKEQPVCEGLEEEYEQIKQKVCSDCPSHKNDDCGYVTRKLQRKCNYLSDVMYGYELGRKSECVKVKAESALDKFMFENCTHCSIEHCPGVKACYTSSNKQLQ